MRLSGSCSPTRRSVAGGRLRGHALFTFTLSFTFSLTVVNGRERERKRERERVGCLACCSAGEKAASTNVVGVPARQAREHLKFKLGGSVQGYTATPLCREE